MSGGTATKLRGGPRRARPAMTEARVVKILAEYFPGVLAVVVLLAIVWALWGKW